MMNKPEFFPIQSLTFDPDLQIRAKINDETIALYAEQMVTEDDMKAFPAIEIFYDGVKYWLADGHHRRAAAEMAGHDKVWAIVKSGTRDDALWGAILGNGKQGFGLTKEDRKRAIMLAIQQWPDRSNVMLAEAIGCCDMTIKRYRDSISTSTNVEVEKRVGRDGKSRPAQQKASQKKATTKSKSTESSQPQETSATNSEPTHSGSTEKATAKTNGSEPSHPNKDMKFVPHTTLKLIPQDSPHVLLVNLFEIFRKGFIEEMVVMAMEMLLEERGKETVQHILAELNKKYGRKCK